MTLIPGQSEVPEQMTNEKRVTSHAFQPGPPGLPGPPGNNVNCRRRNEIKPNTLCLAYMNNCNFSSK